jgi:hypothetical protein
LEQDRVRTLWRNVFAAATGFVLAPLALIAWQPSDFAVELSIHLLLLFPPAVMAFALGRQLGFFARSLPDEDTIVVLWPLLAAAIGAIAIVVLLSIFAISVLSYWVASLVLALVAHRAVRVLFPLDFQSRDFSKLCFAVLVPYSFAAIMAFDLYWVPFDAELVEVEVTAKQPDGTLELKPWGPMTGGDRVQVDENTLSKTEMGQKFHLRYKAGLLGKGWRSVAR